MKTRVLILYLVLILVSVPSVAQADPVTIAAITGMSIFWATVTSIVLGGVLSYGLSLAANALFAKPAQTDLASLGQKIISNTKSTVEPIPVVYGRHKVGGIRVWEEVDGQYLYLVVVFCEGEIGSIESVLIDGVDVMDAKFDGNDKIMHCYTFLGSDDQSVTGWTQVRGVSALDFIAAGAPGWTTDHRMRGCAGAALKLQKNINVFPRIPVITAIIGEGKKVYDPRTLTTATSTNPALCIRDYYTNTRFGAKIPTTRIDEQSWIDAANYFETQANYGNGNQNCYKLNGIIDTRNQIWDNIEELMKSCNSIPKRVNGKHGILPLKAESTTFNFTDDNIIGGINVERLGRRFKKNQVKTTFINPDTDWQPDIYTESDATYKEQDNGIDLTLDLQLPHVIDRWQATHITKIALRQSRLETKISFKANHTALQVQIGDVVDITHSLYGYSGYLLRVTSMTIEPDGTIGIGGEEYDSSVYTVTSANPANPGGTTTFTSPFSVVAPGIPSPSLSYSLNSAGFTVNILTLTWSSSTSPQIAKYRVEYRVSGDTDWILYAEPTNTTINIVDLTAGTYDFAVSAINSIGSVSDRATRSSVGITNSTTQPADVTNFTHEFTSDKHIVLKWDSNSDVTSGGGFRIKLSSKTSGAAWSDFPQLNVLIDGRETTATLGIMQGTYMIKAENLGGTQSANEALIPILLPDNDEWVSVATVTESTAFTGSKTQVAVSTGTLTLDTSSSGGYFTTGSYNWAGTVNLGGTFACRLTRVSSGTLSNDVSNWDSFTGNIDDYTSVMIDSMSGNSSVDIRHFFGTTTESASTGPFGSYNQLQTNETVARQIRFQTTIQTSANTENLNLQELSGTAWLKRRAESNYNVSVSSSGGAVSFSAPFYTTPSVQVFPFNGTAGQYVTATTSQMSRTGFSVSYFTSSGGATAGKISWSAFGHGKEIV